MFDDSSHWLTPTKIKRHDEGTLRSNLSGARQSRKRNYPLQPPLADYVVRAMTSNHDSQTDLSLVNFSSNHNSFPRTPTAGSHRNGHAFYMNEYNDNNNNIALWKHFFLSRFLNIFIFSYKKTYKNVLKNWEAPLNFFWNIKESYLH